MHDRVRLEIDRRGENWEEGRVLPIVRAKERSREGAQAHFPESAAGTEPSKLVDNRDKFPSLVSALIKRDSHEASEKTPEDSG